jgi:hypothetical protein
MRTMIRVKMPVEAGNKAIQDGSLPKIVGAAMDRLKPEAAYFYSENGVRTCLMVVDFKDVTDIPSIAEPFFMGLNAAVEIIPVMNAEELQKGLSKLK